MTSSIPLLPSKTWPGIQAPLQDPANAQVSLSKPIQFFLGLVNLPGFAPALDAAHRHRRIHVEKQDRLRPVEMGNVEPFHGRQLREGFVDRIPGTRLPLPADDPHGRGEDFVFGFLVR